jgi:hypothetical protein
MILDLRWGHNSARHCVDPARQMRRQQTELETKEEKRQRRLGLRRRSGMMRENLPIATRLTARKVACSTYTSRTEYCDAPIVQR